MKIQINRLISRSAAEGPGWRFCIWVQGCDIRCPGCSNIQMHDFNGGHTYDTKDIISKIIENKDIIEGITILGGEPMCQPEAIAEIVTASKNIGLSVLIFTGHTYTELRKNTQKAVQVILSNTDLLIDGPYIRSLHDTSRPWVGSSNQEYHFLSPRYHHLKDTLCSIKNKLELRIDQNGHISINGMTTTESFFRSNILESLYIKQKNI